nr:hypothetical protein [Tanacetum cinerariifolium]
MSHHQLLYTRPETLQKQDRKLVGMLNDIIDASSIAKSHPQRSTMPPTENVPDRTTKDRVGEMWKGDGSTSLSGCGISKTWKCDEFSLPEDFPTASEERFPLLSQRDALAEEVCTADEVKD